MKREGGQSDLESVISVARGWELQLAASSLEDPARLSEALMLGVRSCGGWVLDCRCPRQETLLLEFEFVRGECLEIYCLLTGSGLELSADSHRKLTELCTCTGHQKETTAFEVASAGLLIKQSLAGASWSWGGYWARAG
jgi:hypothetical protein